MAKNNKMSEEEKKALIQELDLKFGSDITDLDNVYVVENELVLKRRHLESCLNAANNEVPTKLSAAIKKAEKNTNQIDNLKKKSEKLKGKIQMFLDKTEPLKEELTQRFEAIQKLEDVLQYLKSFENIDNLSAQLKLCTDDEQAVLIYSELKSTCSDYVKGHRASYAREYTHYWHNVLKDKLSKQYEDVLKLLKWPFTTAQEQSPPPKEVMGKFTNLTRYLLLIQEPKGSTVITEVSGDFTQELEPCLPVRVLLRPLKKRFTFHFTGARQTARIDRPEWFLTQTLTWIKDHQGFIRKYVQPVADKLNLKNIRAEEEFNEGLISLAAERLHTVLGLYNTQGLKGEMIDKDAAFAHAIDETLGFHKELLAVTGNEANSVLSVLTKAETFVLWLAVEKKYALAKMDETLSTNEWMEPSATGTLASRGPKGADWFIALLSTIEQRYSMLPRPGHRLQFLELQLELIEEWRVRLTQLLSAGISSLDADSLIKADDSPHPLTAVVNAAHHTRSHLLIWTHSLHYLQLHYYRRQFEHFTHKQHTDEDADSVGETDDEHAAEKAIDDTMTMKDVEVRAQKLALSEVSRRNSAITPEPPKEDVTSPVLELPIIEGPAEEEVDGDSGVFAEAAALLAHLKDAGLHALCEHIMLEFKAQLREYKKQKWHGMHVVEEMSLSISPPLCRPLAALAARLHATNGKLTRPLADKLRNRLARALDLCLLEEVVLESWWNTGGTIQFNHDVKRNLIPVFAPPKKVASSVNPLPKLSEACRILNMDYEDARFLRSAIAKKSAIVAESLSNLNLRHLQPNEILQILNQRTDLSDNSPHSVMELF